MDGTKGTLLWTNTATDTESFRDVGNFGFRGDFDTELARPDDRARFLAFLTAFLDDSLDTGSWGAITCTYLWFALKGTYEVSAQCPATLFSGVLEGQTLSLLTIAILG